MAQKLEAKGGNGGKEWDDGADHEGVSKIYIREGSEGIESIKFDYVKNGQTEEAPLRGIKGRAIAADPVPIQFPYVSLKKKHFPYVA